MESWKIGIFLILGTLVYQYFDIPLPDDLDEKWKVRIIDATMRTYGHTVAALSALNIMKPFSNLDKAAADFCLNLITTGWPWRIRHDPALKIKDIYTDTNQVHLRVYEPIATLEQQNRPVFVYFHGGGFSLLSIDSYDVMTRKIARDSGITVVSVNYRLSPQYSYPIPQEDCVEAVEYLIENASLLRIDPKRIAIGGDSAGGNLAASISLRMRTKIKLQLLLVPVLHLFNFNTSSIIENKMFFSSTTNNLHQVAFWMNYINESYTHIPEMLENKHTSVEMKNSKFGSFVDQEKWMIRKHIRREILKTGSLEQKKNFGRNDMSTSFIEKLKNPYIAPLMADEDMLVGLPCAYVMTAGYDIIRDDGIMYAERLKNANVNVHIINYKSAFHNTLQFSDGPIKLRLAEQIIQDIVIFLKTNL